MSSVAVSLLFNRVKSPVSVLTRSGITLEVSIRNEDGQLRDVRLRGDARVVYRGTMTAETLAGFDPEFLRAPASVLTT